MCHTMKALRTFIFMMLVTVSLQVAAQSMVENETEEIINEDTEIETEEIINEEVENETEETANELNEKFEIEGRKTNALLKETAEMTKFLSQL